MKKIMLRIRLVAAAAALAATMLASGASGAAEQAAAVVDGLQQRYASIETIEADFTQEFRSAMGSTQTSTGRVYMKKPGRMRWNYTDPVQDEIVSNGATVWVYQPDLNQVIVRPMDEAATSIATDFLSGIGEIRRDFSAEISGERADAWTLSLTPRNPQPNLKSLLIDVDRQTRLAVRTVVIDHFGNETRVSFSNITLNGAMSVQIFEFKPPEGASIIRP